MKMLSRMMNLVKLVFFTALLAGSLGLLAGIFFLFQVAGDLPKLPDSLNRLIETPQTLIYAADGQVIMTLGERNAVPLDRVSPDFINAILATEDHRFYEHNGINKLRMLKGLYVTVFVKGKVQGASTITQQLAKNLFFSFEQSWQRKFKEMLIAFQIETAFSKNEILEAYVNQIHFGAGAQGVEKAARTFFNKSAQDLTLAEASLLAGLPKSPTQLNPFRHYDRAIARRAVVLNRMALAGFISQEAADEAGQTGPVLHDGPKDSRSGSYFVDALIRDLVAKFGEEVVYHGGLRVYATLDPRLQTHALESVSKGLGRLDELMGVPGDADETPQSALVAVDTASGAVKAMVGGRDYYESEFNRAVNGRRQAGSGFKPFLYYAAFEKLGLHPGILLEDRPVSIPVAGAPDWAPRNFEKTFRGPMVLKEALTLSVNTIAAQVVAQAGPKAVIDVARRCGVKSPLEEVYSVALGTSGVTPLDMAAGFSVFANMGVLHEPFLIWRVEDVLGRVIYEQIVRDRQVLDPDTVFQVVDMMRAVVDSGSGRTVRRMGFQRPCAGKTGTTDNYNDAWFTGFTPSLSVSVWTGYDRKKKLRDKNGVGITGGRGAAPIWTEFMLEALKGEPERDFQVPGNIRFLLVNSKTGCPADQGGQGSKTTGNSSKTDIGNQVEDQAESHGESVMIPLKPDQIPCSNEKETHDEAA